MDFTVSIVTSPHSKLVVNKDVDLIKLGLLYADKVTISSPNLYYLLAYFSMATLKGKDRLTFLRGIMPSMYGIKQKDMNDILTVLNQYETIKSKVTKSYQDIQLIMGLEKYIDTSFNSLIESAESILVNSGVEQIIPLIEEGRLLLKDFGSDINQAPQVLLDGAIEDLGDSFTYPIFDKEISELISAYIKENDSKFNYENTKEMVVGKDLFLRLPNVNQLGFDQISLLKKEMEIEWYRYKSLVNEYSTEIEGLPFDPQVEIKLAKKYDKEFKPQLLELQQALDKNSFVKHLYSQILDNITSYSMLCIGTATLTEVKNAMIGASGVVVSQSLKAINEKRKQTEKLKENKLYFYHTLSKYR